MDQTAKLEPYLLLSKSAKGKAAADLVSKVTEDPSLFAFGELLDLPAFKQLQGSDLDPAYKLLELFCYGTWGTWKDLQGGHLSGISLTAQQQLKLKQLTVITLAGQSKNLSYDELMAQLDIQHVRELEDLLISECFYAGLLKGKLDQKDRCLHVQESIARDVKKEEISFLVDGLGSWLQISQNLLRQLQSSMTFVQESSEAAKAMQAEMEANIEAERKKLKGSDKDSDMMMEDTGTLEMMDVEDRALPSGSQPLGSRSKRRR